MASAACAQVNVDTSSIVNNDIAFSVVAVATMRVSNNLIYGNATNFSIAAGGAILSSGNSRITTGGGTPSRSISVQ